MAEPVVVDTQVATELVSGGEAAGPVPEAVVPVAVDPVVESLVARICAQYGARADEVRAHAARLLQGYANARVRSFLPILVEKQLRETYRRRESAG